MLPQFAAHCSAQSQYSWSTSWGKYLSCPASQQKLEQVSIPIHIWYLFNGLFHQVQIELIDIDKIDGKILWHSISVMMTYTKSYVVFRLPLTKCWKDLNVFFSFTAIWNRSIDCRYWCYLVIELHLNLLGNGINWNYDNNINTSSLS